jgi:hypothetical protein
VDVLQSFKENGNSFRALKPLGLQRKLLAHYSLRKLLTCLMRAI